MFSPVKGVCTNCGVVLFGVGSLSDPTTSDPWILRVNTFADFEDAITAKVKAITNQSPSPAAWPWSPSHCSLLAVKRAARARPKTCSAGFSR